MRIVDIHEAATHLSQLVQEAAEGSEIVIARAGKPAARLVPLGPVREPRQPGMLAGRFEVAADFDAPLPEDVIADFEGRGNESDR
jgi:prevent-host-death family protein